MAQTNTNECFFNINIQWLKQKVEIVSGFTLLKSILIKIESLKLLHKYIDI